VTRAVVVVDVSATAAQDVAVMMVEAADVVVMVVVVGTPRTVDTTPAPPEVKTPA
jgi:hypothetical protein